MSETHHLELPLLAAEQAQKHVTVNEALVALDAIVQLSALNRHLTAPPGSPAEGDRHIVGSGSTGAWAGKDLKIALRLDGGWTFIAPQTGWCCWVEDVAELLVWKGSTSAWINVSAASGMLGINGTPTSTNRLTVKSDAALFSHDDVTPGTGDIRLILNKLNAGKSVGLLFQTNWSGRGEMGLTGDDDTHLKVSPNGSTWYDGFVVQATDGRMKLPNGLIIPDGKKIANEGTSAGSGLELEGGGIYGKVALIVKSVTGLTGALFEQRSTNPVIDLVDFGLKTLSHQINMRAESRVGMTAGGFAPEYQVRTAVAGVQANLIAASEKQFTINAPTALNPLAKANLPPVGSVRAGAMVYVTDEAGGAVPAFTDGTNWRRVTDRAIVS